RLRPGSKAGNRMVAARFQRADRPPNRTSLSGELRTANRLGHEKGWPLPEAFWDKAASWGFLEEGGNELARTGSGSLPGIWDGVVGGPECPTAWVVLTGRPLPGPGSKRQRFPHP